MKDCCPIHCVRIPEGGHCSFCQFDIVWDVGKRAVDFVEAMALMPAVERVQREMRANGVVT